MYFVVCPDCGEKVEIPPDAVGAERKDLWNVVECLECLCAFDYEDTAVQHDPTTRGID